MKFFPADKSDLNWISEKLKEEELCYDDLASPGVTLWKVKGEQPVGFFGLEYCGEDALLRSVVVLSTERSKGLGSIFVNEAIRIAEKDKIRNLYLLTFSAEKFFTRFGFEKIERNSVPEAVGKTHEFATFCPDTAVCMMKKITI